MTDDLIRQSDAIKAIEAEECLGYIECKTEHLINQIRTIEIIKPKHGEWIYVTVEEGLRTGRRYGHHCSECDAINKSGPSNFCPNCGADMRGKVNEM